ncbi:MAG: FapA family protein, partial [Deltaproteobacteria bacterium]|nr:FapA family protein [Deltaproteobacteria bacterium]
LDSLGGPPMPSPGAGMGQEAPIPLEQDYPEREEAAETFEEEEQGYWNFLQNLGTIDRRFVYNDPVFPLGPNCGRDPKNPTRIIALANGYGFYHQGLITVKKLLNVRQDVNFHTGNITFVGDIVVHGDVYPGFSLTGSGILVKGRVDGGAIKARGNVVAESGVKGSPDARIRAGLTTRIASCERATVITPGNLVVDGNVLHSELFVGGSLVIKGRLQGGSAHVGGLVYIKEQLGNIQGAPTQIALGYAPLAYLRLQELKAMELKQEQTLANLAKLAHKGPQFAADVAPGQELATRKLEIIERMRKDGWRKFTTDMHTIRNARVIVPGTAYPGVEITIGRAYHKIIDEQRDIFYTLHEEEIVHGFPATTKNWTPLSAVEGDDG